MSYNLKIIDKSYVHFIDGEMFTPSNAEYSAIYDPSYGTEISSAAIGDVNVVNAAVQSSKLAQVKWFGLSPKERARIMMRLAFLVRRESVKLATLESINTGKPYTIAANEIETCARYFEYYAGVADKQLGQVIPSSSNHFVYTIYEPYGVSAHIIPWNAPLSQVGRGAAPALCMGNSVVIKPAQETPITAFEFAKLCIEAGMPAGLVNVVTGDGAQTGATLVSHKDINQITFTGSVSSGQNVLNSAAKNVVPATVELGGKSPIIVFDDADIDTAAKVTARAFTFNSGQICSAGTRLLVQNKISEQFYNALKYHLSQIKIGTAAQNLDMGPVISAVHYQRVKRYIDVAKSDSLNFVFEGKLNKDLPPNGYYIAPIFVSISDINNQIFKEEVFGPVAVGTTFDSEEEAIALANNSQYGLASAIWTRDIGCTHRIAAKLQSGQVYINDYMPVGVEAPFGGYKKSGYGREKGLAALTGYAQIKTVLANTN